MDFSRSPQSLREIINIPYEGPEPVKENPGMAAQYSISGICLKFSSSWSMISDVRCNDVPEGVFRLTIMVPVSSSGISPVGVVRIKYTNSTSETASVPHISHRFSMNNNTPRVYLPDMIVNEALNALRKRAAKLFFSLPFSSLYGFISKAQRAGESVKALIAEMPTATAIVIPNWV